MSFSTFAKFLVLIAALVCGASAALASEAYLYERDGEFVLVEYTSPDTLVMIARGEMFRMTIAPTASGSRYEAEDDRTSFWGKGNSAFVTLRGEDIGEFAAVRRFLAGEPLDGERTAVEASIPIKQQWRLVSVEGAHIMSATPVTITFGHNAELNGHTGVNSFSGSWIATRRSMLIEGFASTRMMAPRDLMDQESRVLDALSRVRGYAIDGDVMTLTTDRGVIIAEKN